jgi:hypothetical protein
VVKINRFFQTTEKYSYMYKETQTSGHGCHDSAYSGRGN